MIAIYAAMDFFDVPALNTTAPRPTSKRGYVVSEIVPFSGRLVTERLACDDTGGRTEGPYVRMFVNEKQMWLRFCRKGNGMCPLDRFIESQSYARSGGGGDWAKCF
jgi:hypothetical protein